MIENERQYRITRAQADKFAQALAEVAARPVTTAHLHPLLRQAQEDGIRSQLTELQAQLAAYEALQSGAHTVQEFGAFEDLPQALIQARIAAGLTQQELAAKLGLKKQQIQQYETTRYAGTSFQRLREVMQALEVQVREEVFFASAKLSLESLFTRLAKLGLDREWVLKRFVPRILRVRWQEQDLTKDEEGKLALQVATVISRVFGWTPAALFSSTPLQLDTAVLGSARFKVPARTEERRMSAYTIYAHYVALLVLEALPDLPGQPIPTDAAVVHQAILEQYGSLTFAHVLRYVWDLGVPVLPLRDSGAFHGACWRVEGRNIIVLKQQTASAARWLNDLLHELHHAGQAPEQSELTVIEASEISRERRESDEEQAASEFAETVALGGRAEELAQACVEAAHGTLPRLKAVVPQVANQAHVAVEVLANYMAYRLSLQGQDWWGAATNLEKQGPDPWPIARDLLLAQLNLGRLNEVERNLVVQALSESEG